MLRITPEYEDDHIPEAINVSIPDSDEIGGYLKGGEGASS
jgi:hypothetical protein